MEPIYNPKPNLTDEQAQQLISDLLDNSSMKDGKCVLATGAVAEAAAARKFKITKRTVYNRWNQALENRAMMGVYISKSNIAGNSGRTPIYNREELLAAMEDLPSWERGNLRSLARGLGVGLKTVWRIKINEKVILPHSNAIKPFLTEQNKLERLSFAADHVTEVNNKKVFKPMYDEIHVDEKWFFISQESQRIYLTQREVEERDIIHRTCKHKSHIIKVMFLCAVARPQYDQNGVCVFDGMIGCWPFTHRVQAQRSSKNRTKGTWETKTKAVGRKEYMEMLVNEVIPAAIAKWPRQRGVWTQRILIQQDNPNTHALHNEELWLQKKDAHPRFKFEVKKQPANSPDTNILDLGFFRSLQTLQWSLPPARNIDELVTQVRTAWAAYDPHTLNKIFLSFQMVMNVLLEDGDGNNNYLLPHVGKDRLSRESELPVSLICSERALSVFGIL